MHHKMINDQATRDMWQPMNHPSEPKVIPPKTIVEGSGMMLTDGDGRKVLDALAGGLWCTNLGHSCEPIKQAISDQLAKLPYYCKRRAAPTLLR